VAVATEANRLSPPAFPACWQTISAERSVRPAHVTEHAWLMLAQRPGLGGMPMKKRSGVNQKSHPHAEQCPIARTVDQLQLVVAALAAALFGAHLARSPPTFRPSAAVNRDTTIMLTLIARRHFELSSRSGALNANTGRHGPAQARFPKATHLPTLHDILTPLGIAWSIPTRNVSSSSRFWPAWGVWFLILAHAAWPMNRRPSAMAESAKGRGERNDAASAPQDHMGRHGHLRRIGSFMAIQHVMARS
jgi:hypothetical protein